MSDNDCNPWTNCQKVQCVYNAKGANQYDQKGNNTTQRVRNQALMLRLDLYTANVLQQHRTLEL